MILKRFKWKLSNMNNFIDCVNKATGMSKMKYTMKIEKRQL